MKRAESRVRKITEMVEMLARGETLYPQKAGHPRRAGLAPTTGSRVSYDLLGVPYGADQDARCEADPRRFGFEGPGVCADRSRHETQAG
jgi:hypothetical protein